MLLLQKQRMEKGQQRYERELKLKRRWRQKKQEKVKLKAISEMLKRRRSEEKKR